jgi:ribosomal protein S18 acetylase RimI-like enzyme
VIRRVETGDWKRLREVRLRALAADPEAFLETVETARAFPAELWRERATPSAEQVTFVEERGEAFEGMVLGFVRGDPATAYLVGMWVAPELRGSGVAQVLVERVLVWAREHERTRVLLSVEAGNDRAARLYEKRLRRAFRAARDAVPAECRQSLLRVRAVMGRWSAYGMLRYPPPAWQAENESRRLCFVENHVRR